MDPAQCRAARGLLDISTRELASESSISRRTIDRFEKGESVNPSTRKYLRETLERLGVRFIPQNTDGVGVRWRAGYPKAKEAAVE